MGPLETAFGSVGNDGIFFFGQACALLYLSCVSSLLFLKGENILFRQL